MLNTRSSFNSSFERVAYYVERVTKNPFLNLGVGLFITISTISNWDTWYATINNGKVELHHGITVAGVWQVLASLPDVVRSSHGIYLTLKHRGEKSVKTTLLHTAEILMEVAKIVITLHRKGVRQEVVDEVHTFVKRIKAIVDTHQQQLKEETSDEHLREDQT